MDSTTRWLSMVGIGTHNHAYVRFVITKKQRAVSKENYERCLLAKGNIVVGHSTNPLQ